MSHHLDIRPVERECICLERRAEQAHIADCNARFRVKFFRTWIGVREEFRSATRPARR